METVPSYSRRTASPSVACLDPGRGCVVSAIGGTARCPRPECCRGPPSGWARRPGSHHPRCGCGSRGWPRTDRMSTTLYRGRLHAPGDPTALLVRDGEIAWVGARRRRRPGRRDRRPRRPADHAGLRRRARARDLHRPGPARPRPHRHRLARRRSRPGRAGHPGRRRPPTARPRLGRTRWPERRPPTSAELDRASYGGGGLPVPDRRPLRGRLHRPARRGAARPAAWPASADGPPDPRRPPRARAPPRTPL